MIFAPARIAFTVTTFLCGALFAQHDKRWIQSADVKVYETPSTSGKSNQHLSEGDVISVLEKSGEWLRVKWSAQLSGYCASNFVTASEDEVCASVNAANGLHLRKEPNKSAESLLKMAHDETVFVQDLVTGAPASGAEAWCFVRCNIEGEGWIKESSTLPDPASIVKKSTTADKGAYHVTFLETIKSKDQTTWVDRYNAQVELVIDGDDANKKTFRGSTLPDAKPLKAKPSDWQFSLVESTFATPPVLTRPVVQACTFTIM
ncbi:MAG: SH3 domain-containing protein [Phycisphaerales bacterium]